MFGSRVGIDWVRSFVRCVFFRFVENTNPVFMTFSTDVQHLPLLSLLTWSRHCVKLCWSKISFYIVKKGSLVLIDLDFSSSVLLIVKLLNIREILSILLHYRGHDDTHHLQPLLIQYCCMYWFSRHRPLVKLWRIICHARWTAQRKNWSSWYSTLICLMMRWRTWRLVLMSIHNS